MEIFLIQESLIENMKLLQDVSKIESNNSSESESINDSDPQCLICKKTFPFESYLKRHIIAVHESRKDFLNFSEDTINIDQENVQTTIESSLVVHEGHKEYISVDTTIDINQENIPTQVKSLEYESLNAGKDHQELNFTTIKLELQDFTFCNCKVADKFKSTHYCEECDEGFCTSCTKAHQRFRQMRTHNLRKINYFCKCKTGEQLLAIKYCHNCSEAFCKGCVISHQRLIVTRNHILKTV